MKDSARQLFIETKTAASALRKRVQMVPVTHGGSPGYSMRLNGEEIGSTVLKRHGGAIQGTEINEQFQGMGLGRKMYGEAIRRAPVHPETGRPTLMSDGQVSPQAQGVWNRLAKNPDYQVQQHPATRLNQQGVRRWDYNKLDQMGHPAAPSEGMFSGSLPAAAAMQQRPVPVKTAYHSNMPSDNLGAAAALDIFGVEKDAFSFRGIGDSLSSFLQRARQHVPTPAPIRRPLATDIQHLNPLDHLRPSGSGGARPAFGRETMPPLPSMQRPAPAAAPMTMGSAPTIQQRMQVAAPSRMAPQPARSGTNVKPINLQHAPRASQRDYEVINQSRDVNSGLGGLLGLSPEGSFLQTDPRFRHLHDPSRIEDMDALAHHLMQHQARGGQINGDVAHQILQSPAYQQSLQHFKYSSEGRRAAASIFKTADADLNNIEIPSDVAQAGNRRWIVRDRSPLERGAGRAVNTVGIGALGALSGLGLGMAAHRRAGIPAAILGGLGGGYLGSKMRVPAVDFFDPADEYRPIPAYYR